MSYVLGLSGGVDSAVSALLLKESGMEVRAVFMRNWEESECPWEEEYQRAHQVAEQLRIPLTLINGSELYYEKVFSRFIKDLHQGLTPNPDIWCNAWVKFEVLCTLLPDASLVTGHYAQSLPTPDGFGLYRGSDPNKDQSYFLGAIDPSLLPRLHFPLGSWVKSDVRAYAEKHGLLNAYQKSSRGICFIGPKHYRDFLKKHVVARPGNIIDEHNRVIGEHPGLIFFTLGQRQGMGIGSLRHGQEGPWYVIERNFASAELRVSQRVDHPLLMHHACKLEEVKLLGPAPKPSELIFAQYRHRGGSEPCHVELDGTSAHVRFPTAQRALTPGQYLVFYDEKNQRVLGSGMMT